MKQFWPVIHHRDVETTLANARLAADCGAYGIFLIQMQGEDQLLVEAAQAVRSESLDLCVGINALSLSPVDNLMWSLDLGMDATWCDHCGVTSSGCDDTAQQLSSILSRNPKHVFFGSVAFKYREHEPDPARAAAFAEQSGFIPVTSGSATGQAPEVSKLQQMFTALRQGQLGLASGVTPENVQAFLPYVSHFLVATGVSYDEHRFNPKKLTQLSQTLKSPCSL